MTKEGIDEIKSEISLTYSITDDGRCINRKRNRDVVFPATKKGYLKTRLWCPGLSKNKDRRIPFTMHRLVAMFYLPNYSKDLQVNHKNGIKTDNRVENLEMCTNSENALHAWNVLESNKERRKQVSLRQRGRIVSEASKLKMSYAKRRINILRTENGSK